MTKNILMIGTQQDAESSIVKNYRLYKNAAFWTTLVQDLSHAKKCLNYSRHFTEPAEKYKLLLFNPTIIGPTSIFIDELKSFLMSAREYIPVGMYTYTPEEVKHFEKNVHYDAVFRSGMGFRALEDEINLFLSQWTRPTK